MGLRRSSVGVTQESEARVAEASARGGKREGMMQEVEKHALGTTLSRDAGRAPSRPPGTAMISEQRVQRVSGTVRGRLRLLTGAVLLSTIAGSAWTDNPVASGEWEQGSYARYYCTNHASPHLSSFLQDTR